MSIVALNPQGAAVTTSLAISEGVGNPHKSVIQLIRSNISDLGEFGLIAFEMRLRAPGQKGKDTEYATLNEQQATLLLTYMRNNDVVRAFKKRLVKAFYELAQERRAPGSKLEILELALEAEKARIALEEKTQALESKILEDAPKVNFASKVELAPDAISVAKAAKILGTGQKRLFAYLRRIGWVTRLNEPYQEKITAGLLDVKLARWEHPEHGLQQSVTTLVTGKGLLKLQSLWRDEPPAKQ